MNARFAKYTAGLDESYRRLIEMEPVTIDTAPQGPVGGVYLFSEKRRHLYVGRTKRTIRERLRYHVSATAKDAPFAWRLAREATGRTRTYRSVGSRKQLLEEPAFIAEYARAKARIRAMDVRFVGEKDPLKQALLEIYVAVATRARYNEFDVY